MKAIRMYWRQFIVVMIAVLPSCSNPDMMSETESSGPQAERLTVLRACPPAEEKSKTVLVDGGDVSWVPGDRIKVFNGTSSASFTAQNTENSLMTDFVGMIDRVDERIWALYPYSEGATFDDGVFGLNIPDMQTAAEGSFSSGMFPSIAVTDTDVLHFKNICGGVKFTVTRSDVHFIEITALEKSVPLAGDISVAFDESGLPEVRSVQNPRYHVGVVPADGGCFKPDVNYYIVLLPGVLSSGFTMDFYTKDNCVARLERTKSVSVLRSSFSRLLNIDKELAFSQMEYTDLSPKETANCYIVSRPGNYMFNASVAGNTTESIGTPASVEVLWRSFGDSVMPTESDIVRLAGLDGKTVRFSTPEELQNGNAVIAVRNSAGTILWSWHIWVCKDFNPIASQQVYNNNAGIMMDRNLGATSATPGDAHAHGLLYQWGRKDPCLGDCLFLSKYKFGDQTTGFTAAWTIKNPMEFTTVLCYQEVGESPDGKILYHGYGNLLDNNNDFWNENKGKHDPCPSGWKVCDKGVLEKACADVKDFTNCYDSGKDGYYLTNIMGKQEIWLPRSYWRRKMASSPSKVSFAALWSNEYNVDTGYKSGDFKYSHWYYNTAKLIQLDEKSGCQRSSANKTNAYPVRCQRIITNGGGDSEGTGENDW